MVIFKIYTDTNKQNGLNAITRISDRQVPGIKVNPNCLTNYNLKNRASRTDLEEI